MLRNSWIIALLTVLMYNSQAQNIYSLSGKIFDQKTGAGISKAQVFSASNPECLTSTNRKGEFELTCDKTTLVLVVSAEGFHTASISAGYQHELAISLEPLEISLDEASVVASEFEKPLARLSCIHGMALYTGMKNDVLKPELMIANTATNNSRQVYSQVPGVNIWESDGAGIQLGIGTRGLSPNRSAHLNVRQNHYDIAADALGYPESYYTPPIEAVERIEFIRGAAALQFGPQFGGLLNFILKQPKYTDKPQVKIRQSFGSFGTNTDYSPLIALSNTHIESYATVGKADFFAFAQRKTSSGWRKFSGIDALTGHLSIRHRQSENLELKAEATVMNYLAQQPGGLTDQQFEEDPRQALRSRNWFRVKWHLGSVSAQYKVTPLLRFESRVFGLLASREALGFLDPPSRLDDGAERNLITGKFKNIGTENRLLFQKTTDNGRIFSAITGVRLYKGMNATQQGLGTAGADANFEFNTTEIPLTSDFTFPSWNAAGFVQTSIPIGKNISFSPGLRFEHIFTTAEGEHFAAIYNGAGTLIDDSTFVESHRSERSFVLAGLGTSWKVSDPMEVYSNFTQNYRPINFNDVQIRNTSVIIDPNMQDETGYNLDLGIRGETKSGFAFDVNGFLLHYNDRIGEYLTTWNEPPQMARPVRFRTNVSDARVVGIESFVEVDLVQVLGLEKDCAIKAFSSASFIHSEYISSEITAFFGNRVEYTPEWIIKCGLSRQSDKWGVSLLYSHNSEQLSDATNAERTPDGVNGIIPAYSVIDFSADCTVNRWKFELSVNNALDARYFTRRATGYPGPGILPSDGRGFFVGAQFSI